MAKGEDGMERLGSGRTASRLSLRGEFSSRQMSKSSMVFLVSVVALCYLLTRAGNLSRDLVSEEAIFLMPGRFLLEHLGYYVDWGVFYPRASAFTKPPLTSLLLGFFSFMGHDVVASARLVPFLVGLVVCLIPLIVTESIVPSLLVLVSPFFYGASGHMQTDPTVGLLGYGLAGWAIARYPKSSATTHALLGAGIIILWLGKIETAVIMTTILAVCVIWQPRGERMRLLKSAAWSTGIGVGLSVFVTWMLGRTAGLPFGESVGTVFQTVLRVTGSTLNAHAITPGAGTHARSVLFRFATDFKVPHLFLLCIIPALMIMAKHRYLWSRDRPHMLLLIAALVPVGVYMGVSYVGDGFPRYFLIAFPPLLILLGLCLKELRPISRFGMSLVVIAIGTALMMPQTWRAIKSAGSPTVSPGEEGTRQAAVLVEALTRPGDLVLAPDNAAFYLEDRRWIIESSFAPYPEMHTRALAMAGHLKAAIVKIGSHEGIVDQLARTIEQSDARIFQIGSYEVVVAESR
jgi:hypothetical protein